MLTAPLPTPQEFARQKLTDWLGEGWEPEAVDCPTMGWHGTRKHHADDIEANGFIVPDRKKDGTFKKRRHGPAVYFFVETDRALATGISGKEAASLYATKKRGWPDATVIQASFAPLTALDHDSWPHWETLILRMEESIKGEQLLNDEERSVGMELVTTHAIKLLEDALSRPVEAIKFWAPDLPCSDRHGYHSLAVRLPLDGRLIKLESFYPSIPD